MTFATQTLRQVVMSAIEVRDGTLCAAVCWSWDCPSQFSAWVHHVSADRDTKALWASAQARNLPPSAQCSSPAALP